MRTIPKGRFTMLKLNSSRQVATRFILFAMLILVGSTLALAQSTVGTGSIQGIVTDPTGAVVGGAKVTIINKGTAATIHLTASSAGAYSSGPIQPADYLVRAEAKGFKTSEEAVTVQVGNTATVNPKLIVGQESQVIEVQGSSLAVNTEQATVQGVLNVDQIENLPVNGRNFLDLAQLEPGVQIQEGSTFDPTKNGFSSISFQGRFGRTARIEVDGVDVSDETVGTTTQNIPASAIQEFQLSQSSLDLSTELTSSGAVNVTTRSGTNIIHGEGFGYFRDNAIAAELPGSPPFQRSQFGGNLGGAVIKDKLFWFLDGERTIQNLDAAEPFGGAFGALNTTLTDPYREFNTDERVDWNVKGNARAFYRFNFDQNRGVRPFGSASSLQGFLNADHTATHAAGFDFNTGSFSHSIRFEYLKFRNGIGDGTSSIAAGIDNPIPGLGINIGAPVAGSCVLSGGGTYCAGPNLLAPQQTIQTDHQIKYDGSKVYGKHVFRYGVAFNHLQGGGLAAFFSFPQAGTTSSACPVATDPTSCTADFVFLGNGIGFSTAKAAFNFPGGGLGPDNRFETYFGDAWKVMPKLQLSLGLHYVHDTGRVDSDLGALPALNQWGAGLGNRVRTPGDDFGPQVGFAWDVSGTGKTVIRGGGGLFFENSIWNNVLFDSPARIPQGIFAYTPLICSEGSNAFTWPTNPGSVGSSVAGGAATVTAGVNQVTPNFCGETISTAGPQILALSSAFKAAAAANVGLQPNGNFVGTSLNAANINGFDVFNPNYRTPRSWQMNIGFQHEIRPGLIISADYIRNIGEHYLIAQDMNHGGSVQSFNQANAIAARDAAQTANGCLAGSGQASCMVTALGVAGAQAAYSGAGLESTNALGGPPCPTCAFPGYTLAGGVAPLGSGAADTVGELDMLNPIGRSVYNGLQAKLVEQVKNLAPGVKSANFQLSYSLSKFISQVQDQDFINVAVNNNAPLQFTGPNALDRTHQISFGGTFDLPFFTKLSLIGHFDSPLPQNLSLPQMTSGGEIFATDWTGGGYATGQAGLPVPGSNLGAFQRNINIDNLQNFISNYNTHFAGSLTPSGNALVSGGVMTQGDMQSLAWVMPALGSVQPGAVGFPWLKSFDFKAAWPIRVKERLTIEPSVSIFNIFNFSNSFLPGNLPGGVNGTLSPSDPTCGASQTCASTPLASSSLGGVGSSVYGGSSLTPYRDSFQSGTYALGAPRQFEFGLRFSF
jgi:hypothetical protein